MKVLLSLLLLLSGLLVSGCDTGPQSPRGFSLPTGDKERGKNVFLSYNCLACHHIESVDDQGTAKELEVSVKLGGTTHRVKTYADLVTSIINPSHRLAKNYDPGQVADEAGKSKMRNYNDVMTVTELIDLVAFLQPHYELKEYPQTTYYGYY